MNTPAACGCGAGGVERRYLTGTAGVYYRRSLVEARRDTCCPLCASGVVELSPAAGYYLPAGGDAASEAAAAQRAREEQAARDREAALRGVTGFLGAAQSGVSEGFATERARIEAEARTATARAESQAITERARIEAARDLELARLRASQPNVTLAPLETPAPVAQRTDAGTESSFPVRTVAVVAVVAAGVDLLSRGGGGGRRRRR